MFKLLPLSTFLFFFFAFYFKGKVDLHGISHLKVYTREIIASFGSVLNVSAPSWNQIYQTRITAGSNGEDGRHGKNGPRGKQVKFCIIIIPGFSTYTVSDP